MFFFLHTPFDFHIFFSHFFFLFYYFTLLTFHIYTVSQSVSFFSIFFLFPERFFHFYFTPNQQALKHWCWAREKEIDTHGRRESKKVEKKNDREVFILSAGSLELYFVKRKTFFFSYFLFFFFLKFSFFYSSAKCRAKNFFVFTVQWKWE